MRYTLARSALLGVREEGFKLRKEAHAEALEQRGLLASEEGLHGMQLAGVCWGARALLGIAAGARQVPAGSLRAACLAKELQ